METPRGALASCEATFGGFGSVSRVSQGGSRELPGRSGERLGVLWGALGEAFGTFGALRGGIGSGNGVHMKSLNYLSFCLVFEVPGGPTACRNRPGATSESLGQPDAGPSGGQVAPTGVWRRLEASREPAQLTEIKYGRSEKSAICQGID